MIRIIQAIMLLLTLAGCVTDAPVASVIPVAPGQASITINRSNGWYGSAVTVDIDANGARIASLAAGGSFTGPVSPGPVTLTATSWSSPGRYTVRFNAQPGKRYAFAVSPRDDADRAGGGHRDQWRNLRHLPDYGCAGRLTLPRTLQPIP